MRIAVHSYVDIMSTKLLLQQQQTSDKVLIFIAEQTAIWFGLSS